MIQSKFISDILDLLLDGDNDGNALRNQIQFLDDIKYDYTGVGLFVTFSYSDEIIEFRLTNNTTVTNGVEIKSSDLAAGADVTLFIKNGIIDYLEIWSKDGNYPNKELTNYTLTQVWIGAPQRQISK